MRLLHTISHELKEFVGSNIPGYAIVSHTWTENEVDLAGLRAVQLAGLDLRTLPRLEKIVKSCQCAAELGLEYVWLDTCCIDKTSSAELSEAINSMYKWYKAAKLCIIYLSDVDRDSDLVANAGVNATTPLYDQIKQSRYFTRGWTLQELVACTSRYFYARDWSLVSVDNNVLVHLCATITGIPAAVLSGEVDVLSVCVAERMSWAARRITTREEDRSYSLLGIFNVHMAVLYGEGRDAAFRRLQEEILKTSFDQTLFVWRSSAVESGLLAQCPEDFTDTPKLRLEPLHKAGTRSTIVLAPFSMTNVGLELHACIWPTTRRDRSLLILPCAL